jgi:plastocyanin
MDDFYFGPTVLTGTPGQTITISLDNHGSALHNFSTTAKDFTDVQPGQSGSVTVTFPQSGFLEFFCKYHRSSGMVGELTTS